MAKPHPAAKKVPPKPAKKVVKKIMVDIGSQRLIAYEDDVEVYKFGCVTGDAKHPTPKGKFKVLQKEKVRRSGKYNAQMNYALQINNTGIFIHESYNYIENPAEQGTLATVVSDTAAISMSRMRSWFPTIAEKEVVVKNLNLIGSHGCIRLAHSHAVKLFDWVEVNTAVEVK
jgi:lipoprotein-anchoring transpeptidase ErfK/SrfK